MKITKEIRIGLLTVVALFMLYWGVKFLKGIDLFKSEKHYSVFFDKVDGLTAGNYVTVNGFNVGSVEKITLLPNRHNSLLVSLKVAKNVPVNDSSVAFLASSGLLGGKIIELQLFNGKVLANDGDTLKSDLIEGLSDKVAAAAMPVIKNLDTVSTEITSLIRSFHSTKKQLDATLHIFEVTGIEVNHLVSASAPDIQATMANVKRVTDNFLQTEKSINTLLVKMNRLGDTLNKAQIASLMLKANKAMESLNSTLTQINKGQGTMGKLVKNDSLYNNLNASAVALDKLLIDFKQNPKRYVQFSVFGNKTKEPTQK